jgi:arylsulfatase A-like enzyme
VRGTTRIQGFDAPSLAEHLRGLGYATAAFVENPQVSRARGFARGFDVWDNPDDRDPPRALLLDPFGVGADLRPLTPKGRDPDARVTAADAWLTNQDRAFLWVHLLGPHLPYHHADTSPGTALGDALGDNPTRLNLDHLRRGSLRWTAALRADVRAAYRAEALRADAALGRLVAAHPDALVVYTADHGEELGEHGGWEHGHALWEEVVRVPLAIAGPGVTPGRFGAASLTDVTPTLLSLVRAGDTPALDGTPLLPGTATPAYIEDTLYLEEREAVVVWPYKLVRTLDGEDERLYDLSTDPNERRDVSAQHPDQLDALTTLLDAERARLGDTSTGSVGERARALGYVE